MSTSAGHKVSGPFCCAEKAHRCFSCCLCSFHLLRLKIFTSILLFSSVVCADEKIMVECVSFFASHSAANISSAPLCFFFNLIDPTWLRRFDTIRQLVCMTAKWQSQRQVQLVTPESGFYTFPPVYREAILWVFSLFSKHDANITRPQKLWVGKAARRTQRA